MTTTPKTQLALVETALSMEQIKERAELLIKSKLLPKYVDTPEKAVAIMLMGQEYGIPPMKAFQSIQVIEGKPTLSAQLMLALCERTGQLEDKKIEVFDNRAEVTLKRKGQTPHTAVFGDADASKMKAKEAVYDNNGKYTHSKTINLIEKYNYRTMKTDMYVARATSRACRRVFPDAVLGLYVPEEAYDVIDPGTEARLEVKAEIAEAAAEKKSELDSRVEAAGDAAQAAVAEMSLMDELGAGYIQDTRWHAFYPEKSLLEILADVTPGGKKKGREFLERVASESEHPDDRAKISKFLELVDKSEAPA